MNSPTSKVDRQWCLGVVLFVLDWVTTDGSFGDPHRAREALEAVHGKPCDRKGGVMNGRALLDGEIWGPGEAYAQVECGDTWAYRALQPSGSTPKFRMALCNQA